jgi:hypothetical protein
MEIQLPLESASPTATLLCPCCGNGFLHHDRVEVFSRKEEDATDGLRTLVENGITTVDQDLRRNPSRRRDAVRISFWCEVCDAKPKIDLVQHKGNTYLFWAHGSDLGMRTK